MFSNWEKCREGESNTKMRGREEKRREREARAEGRRESERGRETERGKKREEGRGGRGWNLEKSTDTTDLTGYLCPTTLYMYFIATF